MLRSCSFGNPPEMTTRSKSQPVALDGSLDSTRCAKRCLTVSVLCPTVGWRLIPRGRSRHRPTNAGSDPAAAGGPSQTGTPSCLAEMMVGSAYRWTGLTWCASDHESPLRVRAAIGHSWASHWHSLRPSIASRGTSLSSERPRSTSLTKPGHHAAENNINGKTSRPRWSRRPCRAHQAWESRPSAENPTHQRLRGVLHQVRPRRQTALASITSGATVPWPNCVLLQGTALHTCTPSFAEPKVRTAAAQALPSASWVSTFRMGAE